MLNSAKEFSKELTVVNELGIHARAAAQIAALAQKTHSGVWIVKDGESVDAASIIDILTLACDQGSRVTLRIQNAEDIEIFNDIVSLFENGFGE
jgi:phosphocarrier protein